MSEKLKCKHCGKTFDSRNALEQHVNDKHNSVTSVSKTKLKKKNVVLYTLLVFIVAVLSYFLYQTLFSSPYVGVGTLGSTHIHADIAIYINGSPITPFPTKYFVRSQYIHVESGAGAGYVIHMHATNVPLSLFFASLGMDFTKSCFKLDTDVSYCNDGNNTLKFYVRHNNGTWQQNSQFGNYVFQDLDKILISYSSDGNATIQSQENSVTDFAKDNSGVSMPLG